MKMRAASELSARFLPALAWILALLLAGAVVAEVVVRYLSPAPVAALPERLSDPRIAAQKLADAQPFGGQRGSAAPQAQAANELSGLALIGVATGFANGPAFALIAQRGEPAKAFLVGDRLPSGMEVLAIHADSVELGHAGINERLMLKKHTTGAPVSAGSQSAGHTAAVSASSR